MAAQEKPKYDKSCTEENQQPNGTFEEDTFRHLLSEKRIILVNSSLVDNMIERVVIPIIGINELDDEAESESRSYKREDNPIRVLINTNGGNVSETLACISAIERSETPVHTYAMGKAYSGGFFLLLAGHKRYCQKYSTLMYHQIQTGLPTGDMTTSREHVEEAMRLQEILNKFVISKSKIKAKQLENIHSKKMDWYFSSEDAAKFGIVDGFYY
jgi:ATP-dependent Clp protease protease subunit